MICVVLAAAFIRAQSHVVQTALCFLTPDPVETTKMRIIILCRTQGQNLSDYMFREGSNVAIHILDNIVLEAADMVYHELRYIATRLQREALWVSLFTATEKKSRETESHLHKVMEICIVRSILDSLGSGAQEGAPEILSTLLSNESGIDWRRCCEAMEKHKKGPFGPCHHVEGNECTTYIVFCTGVSIFFVFDLDNGGLLKASKMVEKDMTITVQQRQTTIQAFADFLLHFIWQGV